MERNSTLDWHQPFPGKGIPLCNIEGGGGMSDVKSEVEKLDGWTLEEEKISKKYKFAKYLDGIDFTEKISIYAEGVQHHPGITINHTTVTVSWTTFSKKELTEKDIAGAKACENLYRLFEQPKK